MVQGLDLRGEWEGTFRKVGGEVFPVSYSNGHVTVFVPGMGKRTIVLEKGAFHLE
jgi:hypothetical protein